jgi:hypothetical protein
VRWQDRESNPGEEKRRSRRKGRNVYVKAWRKEAGKKEIRRNPRISGEERERDERPKKREGTGKVPKQAPERIVQPEAPIGT